MKPTAEKYQAAMKVNALSSEIDNRRKGRQCARAGRQHGFERQYMASSNRFSGILGSGMVLNGLRRNLGDPDKFPFNLQRKIRRQDEKYKGAEMFVRESDKLIVVRRQGNACGAKGLALSCKEEGKHYPDTEQEQ